MYPKSASSWRWPLGFLGAYLLLWIALAIEPVFRKDWLLENLIVFIAVPLFVLTARRLRFSDLAYACLFVFFAVHAIGAHYTYSLVPYADWWQALGGGALEGRNQFDRFVHFLYGLLVTPAAVELIAHYARFPRPWAFLVPWMFMAGHAVIYELIEYAAALAFGGDLGQAYLGTQGDVWDSQKDMALALAGTTIMLAALGISGWLERKRGGPAAALAGPLNLDRPAPEGTLVGADQRERRAPPRGDGDRFQALHDIVPRNHDG